MIKKIKEIIENITNHTLTEEKTKQSIIEPILSELGWNLTLLSEVQREYKNVVDYRLKGERISIFIEAKRIGKSLISAMQQVKNYSLQNESRPDFLITTNGINWDCYSIRYAIQLFSISLKSINKKDESIFKLISKENVNNGLLMNYSNEMKTQVEVLDYLNRNTNKIADEMTKYDSSFNQESIKKVINAITKKSYIRVSSQNVNQNKYIHQTPSPTSYNYTKPKSNRMTFSGSQKISELKKEYLLKVINRLKEIEQKMDLKYYVRFGIRGQWSNPNYQVEDESMSNFYTFYGKGLQKPFDANRFNDSNITPKRFSISELEEALKD